MNRLIPIAGVALALAVVACANPTKDKPKAVVSPASPAELKKPDDPKPQPEATSFAITPENSKIEWVGAKVSLKHDGGFGQFAGTVQTSGNLESAKFTVTIEAASIWSDNEKLTGHLKSPDFFDVEKHPQASFTSTTVKRSPEGGTHDITGTLELAGIAKTITFPATLSLEGDTFRANAEFAINRKDFGIVYPGMPDDLIHDEVLIKLSVAAQKQ